MSGPVRIDAALDMQPGESADDWFRRTYGPIPAPTAPSEPESTSESPSGGASRLRRARALLERSIPPSHRWATLDAPELPGRVSVAAIAIGRQAYLRQRVCLTGSTRGGKTSLAVAMLRAWVAKHERAALFLPAYRLGVARLQHPAGHGEAELVKTAMQAPLVLLDDVGSERDFPTNPIADVIFERHAQDLPTWMTTGLTRDLLVARYGAGVVARLFERAKVIHVEERSEKTTRVEK